MLSQAPRLAQSAEVGAVAGFLGGTDVVAGFPGGAEVFWGVIAKLL